MNAKDALAELRLQGVEDLSEVQLAQVEVDGQVSVLRQEWASPVQKADLFPEAARERERARSGRADSGRTAEPGS